MPKKGEGAETYFAKILVEALLTWRILWLTESYGWRLWGPRLLKRRCKQRAEIESIPNSLREFENLLSIWLFGICIFWNWRCSHSVSRLLCYLTLLGHVIYATLRTLSYMNNATLGSARVLKRCAPQHNNNILLLLQGRGDNFWLTTAQTKYSGQVKLTY